MSQFGRPGFGDYSLNRGLGDEVSLSYLTGLPDINTLQDPSLRVLFKNLLKRDVSTREKALSELVLTLEGSDPSLLDSSSQLAWVQAYAKLSIDNSHLVRSLSHKIQGSICSVLGKQSSKHLKSAIGPWLIGTFDNDREVAATANEALKKVFPTESKIDALWKVFELHLLEFVDSTICNESVLSLSDERYITKDEAQTKYWRVLRGCVLLMDQLVLKASSKNEEKYLAALGNAELWKHSRSPENALARSLWTLAADIAKSHHQWAELLVTTIASNLFKALKSAHSSLATDLIQVLIVYSKSFSSLWEMTVSKKSLPFPIFLEFLEHGSRRSSRFFWPSVLALISTLPENLQPYSRACSDTTRASLFSSLLKGVLVDNQPLNQSRIPAWGSYLTVIERSIPVTEEPSKYISDALDNVVDGVVASKQPLSNELSELIRKKLSSFATSRCEAVAEISGSLMRRLVLDSESLQLERYLSILPTTSESGPDPFNRAVVSYLEDLLSSASNDDAKPQLKAVAILLSYLPTIPDTCSKKLVPIVSGIVPSLITSDVALDGIKILSESASKGLVDGTVLNSSLEKSVTALLESPDKHRSAVLSVFLDSAVNFAPCIKPSESLSNYVLTLLDFDDSEGLLLSAVCAHGVLISESVAAEVVTRICNVKLRSPDSVHFALDFLSKLLRADEAYFTSFIATPDGKSCVSYIWTLEDEPLTRSLLDNIEAMAITGSNQLNDADTQEMASALCDTLLNDVSAFSDLFDESALTRFSDRAQRLLVQNDKFQKNVMKQMLNGIRDICEGYLAKSFNDGASSDISTSDILGGSVLLVSEKSYQIDLFPVHLVSVAIFAVGVVRQHLSHFLQLERKESLGFLITVGLVSQVLSTSLYITSNTDESFTRVSELVLQLGDDFLGVFTESASIQLEQLPEEIVSGSSLGRLWSKLSSLDSESYYHARLLATIINRIFESATEGEVDSIVSKLRPQFSKSILGTSAVLQGLNKFASSPVASTLRNQYSSSFIRIGVEKIRDIGLQSLVHLNLIGFPEPYDSSTGQFRSPLPANRLVMFLNSLLSWHDSDGFSKEFLGARIELTKFLIGIVNCYRQQLPVTIMDKLFVVLEQNIVALDGGSISLRYFTLQLFNLLDRLRSTFPELDVAWKDQLDLENLVDELLELVVSSTFIQSPAQPEVLANLQLQKALWSVPKKFIKDPERLFSVMSCNNLDILRMTFVLLDDWVPTVQEELSIEFELLRSSLGEPQSSSETSAFNIPNDLVKMVANAPESGSAEDDIRYLWNWKLVFDHFSGASSSLRRAHIKQLRDAEVVDTLLNFIADFITGNDGFTKSVTKLMEKYSGTVSLDKYNGRISVESLDEEVQLLVIHTYYLALRHVGQVSKIWYSSVRKRSVMLAVEKLTKELVSPKIIAAELAGVDQILAASTSSLNDDTMSAKTSAASGEVKAFYTTDGQTMEIAVRLPPMYPLRDMHVEGILRFGVKEKQWRAWLLASQAVGTAQSGGVVDALELFKRNVSLYFEGMEECAICYAIIHEDQSLPNKTCSTCKKKFHADCLYRWFKSAGSDRCPLCRSELSFRTGLT